MDPTQIAQQQAHAAARAAVHTPECIAVYEGAQNA